MNLRDLAEQDLSMILEDNINGFGCEITLISPDGVNSDDLISGGLIGYSNDISQVIDPDTGMIVSGRSASVSIRISTLILAGMTLPKGIADTNFKPWVVKFKDINLDPFTFKVQQSNPDRTLGIVTLLLELYNDN
jgi:hypothetical protein